MRCSLGVGSVITIPPPPSGRRHAGERAPGRLTDSRDGPTIRESSSASRGRGGGRRWWDAMASASSRRRTASGSAGRHIESPGRTRSVQSGAISARVPGGAGVRSGRRSEGIGRASTVVGPTACARTSDGSPRSADSPNRSPRHNSPTTISRPDEVTDERRTAPAVTRNRLETASPWRTMTSP